MRESSFEQTAEYNDASIFCRLLSFISIMYVHQKPKTFLSFVGRKTNKNKKSGNFFSVRNRRVHGKVLSYEIEMGFWTYCQMSQNLILILRFVCILLLCNILLFLFCALCLVYSRHIFVFPLQILAVALWNC